MSSNTAVSRDSSSVKLHSALKPEEPRTTLGDALNFSLDNLTRGGKVKQQVFSPARLLSSSCSLEKTLRCSCAFHGVPTPTVQWWMGGAPVDVNPVGNILQVTFTTLAPWANSTIRLVGEPEVVTRLHCEGKNQYGTHTSGVFLIPDQNSISGVFLKGLIQGLVYGAVAAALLLLFLVLLGMKLFKWWEERQILKAKAAQTLKKPEPQEEPAGPENLKLQPSGQEIEGPGQRGKGAGT
ncbi:PREDICTED: SIGLEC family-like protein 1 [Chinchilla lanigera]|uniref:SIGLEC family-like protein 1 n=1 Tax=Chinchilla lanigera TaxID=34839 RepID=UPI00038EF70E|nr:PREDICTED: SIGLEC family-like protein 1 [Chinchilla lanigera]XP_005412749.1 PREDICTED: SIGLEC family-like protein 1 [Chinchilla lanigera]XP_005412750.1 PREDICTED: SIGLEC family-like protein 1 [Chinchilla lanigera]